MIVRYWSSNVWSSDLDSDGKAAARWVKRDPDAAEYPSCPPGGARHRHCRCNGQDHSRDYGDRRESHSRVDQAQPRAGDEVSDVGDGAVEAHDGTADGG